MTDVAFHFNAPDKLAYACRLLRKAVGSGSRVVNTSRVRPTAFKRRQRSSSWARSARASWSYPSIRICLKRRIC